jgi:hypothetical protein
MCGPHAVMLLAKPLPEMVLHPEREPKRLMAVQGGGDFFAGRCTRGFGKGNGGSAGYGGFRSRTR